MNFSIEDLVSDYSWSYLYARKYKEPTGFCSIQKLEEHIQLVETKISKYLQERNITISQLWRRLLKSRHHEVISALSIRWLIKEKKSKIGAIAVLSKKEFLEKEYDKRQLFAGGVFAWK